MDHTGPATAKWDYLAADGSLIACVYRIVGVHPQAIVPVQILLSAVTMLAGFDGDITSLIPHGATLEIDPAARSVLIVE